MPLSQQVNDILSASGYSVERADRAGDELHFEDYSLFGYVRVYESVRSLLDNWRTDQDRFLSSHAPFLRKAQHKAWNCYAIYLTEAELETNLKLRLLEIEEDFVSTRKIARTGVTTEDAVRRALYSLLPLQNSVAAKVNTGESDLTARLHDWPSEAIKALFGLGTAEDIIELLLEKTQ